MVINFVLEQVVDQGIFTGEHYKGATTNVSNAYAKEGVGASALLEYAGTYQKKRFTENIYLFFDNSFISMFLLEMITAKAFYATGTVREKNRLPENSLEDKKMLEKSLWFIPQNTHGSYFGKIGDQYIMAVNQNDNSLVTLCFNYAGVEHLHNVKPYYWKKKQNVQVSSGNNYLNCSGQAASPCISLKPKYKQSRPTLVLSSFYPLYRYQAIIISFIYTFNSK